VKINAADRLGINRNTLHKKIEEYEQADVRSGGEDEAFGEVVVGSQRNRIRRSKV
jgi:hypothetical protein